MSRSVLKQTVAIENPRIVKQLFNGTCLFSFLASLRLRNKAKKKTKKKKSNIIFTAESIHENACDKEKNRCHLLLVSFIRNGFFVTFHREGEQFFLFLLDGLFLPWEKNSFSLPLLVVPCRPSTLFFLFHFRLFLLSCCCSHFHNIFFFFINLFLCCLEWFCLVNSRLLGHTHTRNVKKKDRNAWVYRIW